MERNTAATAAATAAATDNRPAPRFAVGDWAYNCVADHNARIVAIFWDEIRGSWMYNVPGYCVFHITPELPFKPYHRYRQVNRHAYEDIGPCSRDDHNIPLQKSTEGG